MRHLRNGLCPENSREYLLFRESLDEKRKTNCHWVRADEGFLRIVPLEATHPCIQSNVQILCLKVFQIKTISNTSTMGVLPPLFPKTVM